MANVQAQVTGLPAAHNDEGSTSALGMYDEPDHGLDFNSTLRRNEGL